MPCCVQESAFACFYRRYLAIYGEGVAQLSVLYHSKGMAVKNAEDAMKSQVSTKCITPQSIWLFLLSGIKSILGPWF